MMTHTGENSFRLPKFKKNSPKALEWTEMCMRDTTQDIFGGVKWKTSFNFVLL